MGGNLAGTCGGSTMSLSDAAREVICRTLQISSPKEAIDRDFEPKCKTDLNRKATETLYNKLIRGSVRLKAGRFYTTSEFQERVARIKALPLP